jgi:hypothetical protein
MRSPMAQLAGAVITVTTLCACATAEQIFAPALPLVASLEPVVSNSTPAAGDQDEDINTSAGDLLEQGLRHFARNETDESIQSFQAAIRTGHLNDAGRALAYWHIFNCENDLGHTDASLEALSSFVIVGQDTVDMRSMTAFAVDDSSDFVERFDLERRLARARAILSSTWIDRAGTFGKSADFPVRVEDAMELTYLLEMIPPCTKAEERTYTREEVFQQVTHESVQKIRIRCESDATMRQGDVFIQVKKTASDVADQ